MVRRAWVRTRWVAVIAGVLALVALGCSADEGATTATPVGRDGTRVIDSVPFLEGATSGPGTELRDGITVVDGSRILAGPLPQQFFLEPDEPDLDRGWSALAVVTGDVRGVLEGYAAQASSLGLAVPVVQCVAVPSTRPAAVPVTSCTAATQSADGRLAFRLDDTQSPGLPGFMPVSHVWVTVRRLRTPSPFPEPSGVVAGVPVADPGKGSELAWPRRLPGIGDRFEPGTDVGPGFVVQPGTHLVGPPGVPQMSADVETPTTILRIDGPVAPVVDAFRKAFHPGYEKHTRSTEEGVRVEHWYWTNGDTATVDVYRQDGRPTWMVLWHASGD
jgi:hypothetical protein